MKISGYSQLQIERIVYGYKIDNIQAITFDLFGTVFDLKSTFHHSISNYLSLKPDPYTSYIKPTPDDFWAIWRERQRIEQFQDSLLMTGHSGYLETARKALLYALRYYSISFTDSEVNTLMDNWQNLQMFPDVIAELPKLHSSYKLVVLSNGDKWFLDHLVKNCIDFQFDAVISVDGVGFFKPHPSVYLDASKQIQIEPEHILMVSSNRFDITGARSAGYQAALVDRYHLPQDESVFQPNIVVENFEELSKQLASPLGSIVQRLEDNNPLLKK
jgi:2-haloacid dehalogenase